MILQLYTYHCGNCKNKFTAGKLPEETYGEFLLRSKTGETVYLNALCDSVFSDLIENLKKNPLTKALDDSDQATVLHYIYNITCDAPSDNSKYIMEAHPVCPNCKSNNMLSWRAVYPSEIANEKILPVTYERWNTKSSLEKTFLIDEAIKKCLAQPELFI